MIQQLASGWKTKESGFDSQQGQEIFVFTAFIPCLLSNGHQGIFS
jgi:hypothetical protein